MNPSQAPPTQPTLDAHKPEPPPAGQLRPRKGLGNHHKTQHMHNRKPLSWIYTKTPKSKIPPLGSPFAEAYTTTTGRGAPSAMPPASLQTENFYTLLYTDSHETCPNHTSAHTKVAHDTHPTVEAVAASSAVEAAAAATKAEAEAVAAAATEAEVAKTTEAEVLPAGATAAASSKAEIAATATVTEAAAAAAVAEADAAISAAAANAKAKEEEASAAQMAKATRENKKGNATT